MYERLFSGSKPEIHFPVDLDSEIRHKRGATVRPTPEKWVPIIVSGRL